MDALNQSKIEIEVWHTPLHNWRKSWAGWLVCGIGVALFIFVVVHQLGVLILDETKVYSDWMQGICAVAATILGWRVTQHPRLDKATKTAYWFFTGSYFAFAFGAIYWIVFNCILGKHPYISLGESFADVGFWQCIL
jgi:xanthine/uracil permease